MSTAAAEAAHTEPATKQQTQSDGPSSLKENSSVASQSEWVSGFGVAQLVLQGKLILCYVQKCSVLCDESNAAQLILLLYSSALYELS